MSDAGRVRAALGGGTRWSDIRWLDEVDSTNRLVAELGRGEAPEGLVVATDFQTAGRGRLDRRWEAPRGSALLASMLLRPIDLAPPRRYLATAAVALAARRACTAVAGVTAELKWPNDLLVGDAKLAGILAEATADAVVVGIGLNVSVSPPGATDLVASSGRSVERPALLAALLGELDDLIGRWDVVEARYRAACATIGRHVRIEAPGRTVEGRALDVDHLGRLVVRRQDATGLTARSGAGGTTEAWSAGDVTHVRPGRGAASWSAADP